METASLSGILLVDKAEGVTSRQIDNAIQKAFKTRKVGHLGTLDPFATGLLLVAVNKATKYLPFLDDTKKRYVASLRSTRLPYGNSPPPLGLRSKSRIPVRFTRF